MSPLELPADDPRPALNYPLYETYLHKLVVWLARHVFRLFMVMQVHGLENLPETGSAVLAANHLVMFDVFPVQLALPRMVFYMGKAELFQNNFVHSIFRRMGAFPVYRGERDNWALDHARKLLASDQIVAMFPEGTRSKGKGLALARPGAAKLAIEMRCPVVVVSVDGIQNLFKKFPRRTIVRVVIAPLIKPTMEESPLALTDTLMYTMAENLPPELRGVYSERPKGFI
ncbi:MAG: lysophospholipid acyltransferase family protein [Chloroflexi bacterium]|nr:lysophospholipid acyltransferase family protein [Chloroflexota bacterium]